MPLLPPRRSCPPKADHSAPRAGIHKRGAAHPEHRRRVERGEAQFCQYIALIPTSIRHSCGGRNPSLREGRRTPRRAWTPLPRRGGSRTALTSAKPTIRLCPIKPSTPKCDINPLTLLKHLYYLHLRLARHHPHDLRRTQHPGKNTGLPRTQRPSPSREPARAAPGSSERRHLLSQVPPAPLPMTQAMEDALNNTFP